MNKAPAFQFYAQDFLTGVVFLTNEEIGMYIKLLAKQWTDGKIPMRRVEFLIGQKWDNVPEELQSKFQSDGDFLWNERLENERQKMIDFTNKQRENGKKGGRPKNPNKTQTKPNDKAKKSLSIEEEDRSKKTEVEKEEFLEKSEKPFKTETLKAVVDDFNRICTRLASVQKLTESRKTAIKNRAKEYSLQKIGAVFEKVNSSRFLNGENNQNWKATFDWVMKPSNFIKILEGNYDNKTKSNEPAEAYGVTRGKYG